jgi:hypothetical protein
MLRTQCRVQHVTEAPSLRIGGVQTQDHVHLRQEPGAGKPHAGICGGSAGRPTPLPDKVHCGEGVAIHTDPEPCVISREGVAKRRQGSAQASNRAAKYGMPQVLTRFTTRKATRTARHRKRPMAWRGQRTWHVQKLLVREPGDLASDRSGQLPLSARIGKARSRSR